MLNLKSEPVADDACPSSSSRPAQQDYQAIAEIAARSLALRQWERQNLPIEASLIGFELFMRLAEWSAAGQRDRTTLLKQLYLALPYSEKGVRLHLRRLEAAGWVKVHRGTTDSRGAQVELSDVAWELLSSYVEEWRRHHPSPRPD